MTLLITKERHPRRIAQKAIIKKIQYLLEHLGRGNSEISLLLTDDAGITYYNERFLKRPGPTNVISFGAGRPFALGPDILGDVVVNIDAALRQSEVRGVSLTDEIIILTVHGLVHLLGFTHDTKEGATGNDALLMDAKERELLSLIEMDTQ